MADYRDPADEFNGPKYRTGKLCIEGCGRPAGTRWSPLWCHECNVKRMDRIGAAFDKVSAALDGTESDKGQG